MAIETIHPAEKVKTGKATSLEIRNAINLEVLNRLSGGIAKEGGDLTPAKSKIVSDLAQLYGEKIRDMLDERMDWADRLTSEDEIARNSAYEEFIAGLKNETRE